MRDIQVFFRLANSRIPAPLISMLKTLSTESAEPKKGVVGIDGGGRNRAEPVGKYEIDSDRGVGRNGDFIQSFMVILT